MKIFPLNKISYFSYIFLTVFLFSNCDKDDDQNNNTPPNELPSEELPIVKTLEPQNILTDSVDLFGEVLSEGDGTLIARGFCIDILPEPDTNSSCFYEGNATGTFSITIYQLTPNTTYYVRAYATNSFGTSYGEEKQFTTKDNQLYTPGGGVTDIVGNSYPTVIIGTQEWMAENLRTELFSDGNPIYLEEDNTLWRTDGDMYPLYCLFDNNGNLDPKYGYLYNWLTVSRNPCPSGWHVPSDSEWQVLIDFLGGDNVAGGKLKATGFQYWARPNTGATNESGFNALGGGYRRNNGTFNYFSTHGYWWSSTSSSSINAFFRRLESNRERVYRNDFNKNFGMCIRCIKD